MTQNVLMLDKSGIVLKRCARCKHYCVSIGVEPCSSCWPRVYMGEDNPGFEPPNKEDIERVERGDYTV